MNDLLTVAKSQFNKTIELNDEAYNVYPGPVLLLAGPGTGKTYQIAKRIQFLTSEEMNVGPDEITVITFTKEAAQSMRDKISQKGKAEFVEGNKRPKTITTMHSLGQSIILENLAKVGLKSDFELVESENLKKILIHDAASLLGFSVEEADEALEDRRQARTNRSNTSNSITKTYEQMLRKSNAIDYDDQILLATALLEDPAIRKKWSKLSKHLLIDEYQDINDDQFRFIRRLCADHIEGLFVVGDDDQSIYKFRGGSPEYIRKFDEHFGSNSRILQLQISRRCLKNILDCANHLVSLHDVDRMPKVDPKYHKEESGQVLVHDCPSDTGEAKSIATIIKNDIDNAEHFRKIFILILNRHYSKKIEESLKAFRVNYQVHKSSNENVEKFMMIQAWIERTGSNVQLRQAIQLILDGGSTVVPGPKAKSEAKKKDRQKVLDQTAGLWKQVLTTDQSLWKVLEEQSQTNGVFKDVRNKLNALSASYQKNLSDFLKQMVEYVKPWSTKDGFYQDISVFLKSTRVAPGGNYQIRLLSLQASKGLEADLVFVIGLEEGSCLKGDSQLKSQRRRG
jgi:DNA helicase II / ATP-dependent DNA helicase PcrA